MEAMILAAGLGTRLRPLTDRVPKALIEVGGIPVLERVARRLVAAGAERLIINVHHHARAIERFVADREAFGVEVVFSREKERPLETGGGLAHAAPLFRGQGAFLLHNVDVVTDLDLQALVGAQWVAERERPTIATLAVSDRETSRPLLVDAEGVFGRADRRQGWEVLARPPAGERRAVGFSGVHAISRRIFGRIARRGAFSIVDAYLRLVGEGERVAVHDMGDAPWADIGSPERLARARARFGGGEPGPAIA